MTDIISDAEATLKEMTRLWNEAMVKPRYGRRSMSFQRFKILRAIRDGKAMAPDICQKSELDRSTTARILKDLREDGYVTRKPYDERAFVWGLTEKGEAALPKLDEVLELMAADLKHIAKSRLGKWI